MPNNKPAQKPGGKRGPKPGAKHGGGPQGQGKKEDKEKEKEKEIQKKREELNEFRRNLLTENNTDGDDVYYNYLKAKNIIKHFEEDLDKDNIKDFDSRRKEYAKALKDLKEYEKSGGPVDKTKLTYVDSVNADYFQNMRRLSKADTNSVFQDTLRKIKFGKEEIYKDAMFLDELSKKIETNITSVYNKMKIDMSSNLDNLDAAVKEARKLQRSSQSAAIVNEDMTRLLEKIIESCGNKVQDMKHSNKALRNQLTMKILPLYSKTGRLCVQQPLYTIQKVQTKKGFLFFSSDEFVEKKTLMCIVAPHTNENGDLIEDKQEEVDEPTYNKWKNIFEQVSRGRLRFLRKDDLDGQEGELFKGHIFNLTPGKGKPIRGTNRNTSYDLINLYKMNGDDYVQTANQNKPIKIAIELPPHLPVMLIKNLSNATGNEIAEASFKIDSLREFSNNYKDYYQSLLQQIPPGYVFAVITITDDQVYFNNYSLEPEYEVNTKDPFIEFEKLGNKNTNIKTSDQLLDYLNRSTDVDGKKKDDDDDD